MPRIERKTVQISEAVLSGNRRKERAGMNVAVAEVPAARFEHTKEWFEKMNGDDVNGLRGISPAGSDAFDKGYSTGFQEKSPSCATVLHKVAKEFLNNGRAKRWFAAGCAVSPNGGRLFAEAMEII